MSTFVWQISTNGGTPQEVTAAVRRGVERLRAGDGGGLSSDEVEPWSKDVSDVSYNTAADDGRVSVLVDITLYDASDATAAVLSGGFDEVVLDEVLTVDGVITASHSDRIGRDG